MSTVLIDKNDSRLKSVKFLTSCMSKEKGDFRFHIKHFKVEVDGSGVATDGSRLHWSEVVALEAGYYQVHKNNKASVLVEKVHNLDTDEGSFPDYAYLLLTPEGEAETEFDVMATDEMSVKSGVYTKVVRAMTNTILNFQFVSDICTALDGDIMTVTIPEAVENHRDELETNKPVHFQVPGFHAIVMPLNGK